MESSVAWEGARWKRRQGGRRGNSLERAPLHGKERDGSDDKVDGSVGTERDGSDNRVDGGETVGNSSGEGSVGTSETEVTT